MCCREARKNNLSKFASVMAFNGNVHAPLVRQHGDNDQYVQLGTIASLDAVFDSHPLIKHALANEVALTNTFLVRRDEVVDRIFSNSPINQIYSPSRCHRKTVSRCAHLHLGLCWITISSTANMHCTAEWSCHWETASFVECNCK
jgi:hypothetical protein